MSVITAYARLDEPAIEALRADPEWLDSLYGGHIGGAHVVDVDKACGGIVWLLSRLPSAPATPVAGAGFVLRRSLGPLVAGEGGVKEPRLEAPYGPAHNLSPSVVSELSSWLDQVSVEELAGVYDPKALARAGVYPQIWMQQGRAALDEYLVPHFKRLQAFFREARTAGQAVLVFVT